MTPGTVVICANSQAGTVTAAYGETLWILTQSGNIWIGPAHQCREPQDQEELDACPIEVPRVEPKVRRKS